MNDQDKQLVQESWAQVTPIADEAAKLFYRQLFTLDPELEALFPSDLTTQRKKLMSALTVVVRGLDDLDTLVPVVQRLGARHVGYGVEDAHYDTVGQALLWTLEAGLGDAFTPEVKAAWTTAYTTLATIMKDAASQVVAGQAA